MPDIGADSMIGVCKDVSTDFSKIEVGEAVWCKGHIGIYIGGGLAVECTPAWKNCVQITACNCTKSGYSRRNWTKHGKLPYVSYTGASESVNAGASTTTTTKPSANTGTGSETVYVVKKGDTLSAIARKYGTTYQKLAQYNGIANPNIISIGQKIKIPGKATQAAAWVPKKGDIVNFTGNKHYASANAANGPSCKPGKAKITADPYQLGKSKHPYHLVAVKGGGSTVYGWVDAGTFTKA